MLPISIIIPCYNAVATLARTLDSCVTQSEAAQIIVVDDGSTDHSVEVVSRYRQCDDRITLLQMPVNGGSARARNWAAVHASQPLLAFIDADDEYLPGALAAASDFLERNSSAASVRLDVEYVNFPPEIVGHPDFENYAAVLSNTVPSSLIIRRPVYAALGGFPMDDFFRRHGGEDGALSFALLKIFGNPRLVDSKRVRMHYHASIHAERFFRIGMGMETAEHASQAEAIRLSNRFVDFAQAGIRQLRTLSALSSSVA